MYNIHRQTLYCKNFTSKKKKSVNLGLGWLECLGLKLVKWLYNSTNCVIYIAVKKSNVSDIFFSACQHVSEEMEQREVPFDYVNSPL